MFVGLPPRTTAQDAIAEIHYLTSRSYEWVVDADISAVLTVEEHSVIGGLGSAVAEVLAERAPRRVPLRRLGVADTFGESGAAEDLLERRGLATADFVAAARELVRAK